MVTIDTGLGSTESIEALPPDTAAFGDGWLASRRSATLRVPSVIAPDSFNVLINPAHPDAASTSISARQPFAFDRRLWPEI